jgi:hypothetical protein
VHDGHPCALQIELEHRRQQFAHVRIVGVALEPAVGNHDHIANTNGLR